MVSMEFPPIDEPAIKAVNDVIRQCENTGRLFETAIPIAQDETIRPLLRQGAEAYGRVVEVLRDGLFASTGAASGSGTVKGLIRRIHEEVGQRAGWRDRTQLLEALLDEQRRTLAHFDSALDRIDGNRLAAILAAQRTIVAGLTGQIEAIAAGN